MNQKQYDLVMSSEVLTQTALASVKQRGRNLEYLTIGWNSLEAVAAISAGLLAGSIALVGFGFDSVIESLSSAVVLWRLFAGDVREKLALRLVGASWLPMSVLMRLNRFCCANRPKRVF